MNLESSGAENTADWSGLKRYRVIWTVGMVVLSTVIQSIHPVLSPSHGTATCTAPETDALLFPTQWHWVIRVFDPLRLRLSRTEESQRCCCTSWAHERGVPLDASLGSSPGSGFISLLKGYSRNITTGIIRRAYVFQIRPCEAVLPAADRSLVQRGFGTSVMVTPKDSSAYVRTFKHTDVDSLTEYRRTRYLLQSSESDGVLWRATIHHTSITDFIPLFLRIRPDYIEVVAEVHQCVKVSMRCCGLIMTHLSLQVLTRMRHLLH